MKSYKVAVLTIDFNKSPLNDDPSFTLLALYQLRAPSLKPYDPKQKGGRKSIEGVVSEQLDKAQLVATKMFEDERSLSTIAVELARLYDGTLEGPGSSLPSGVSGSDRVRLIFPITAVDRIVNDYFIPPPSESRSGALYTDGLAGPSGGE